MNLRPKTIHRLLVLLTSTAAFAVAASIVVVTQLHRYQRHRLALRDDGMAAYQHGDYHTAADDLSKYLGNDLNDSEAIFAYAVSRKKLLRPDLGNLLDARQLFAQYLTNNPGDSATLHQLLEINLRLHDAAESSSIADQILAGNPDDVQALTAKLQQLVRDIKFTQALPISMRLNELTPDDLRTQETTFFLMSRLGRTPPELIARADAMLAAHPRDPHFELLRAVAAYFANEPADARQWLQTAAAHPAVDANFTLMLVSDFDRMELWGDSLDLLKRVEADPAAPVAVKAALAQRLWEFKQFDSALALLKNVNPKDPAAESQLLGLKGLVLHDRFGNTPEFNSVLKSLQARPDDMVAAAWSLLLTAISTDVTGEALPPVQQCVDAGHADPDNAIVRDVLAGEYERLGETELALQCLRQTVKMQPEWPAPWLEMSRILLNRGQAFDAVAPATAACERDPNLFEAQNTLLQAEYEQLGPDDTPAQIKPILNQLEQSRTTQPLDPDLMAMDVDLLARSMRKNHATELAMSAIEHPGTAYLLRRLAIINQSDQLGISTQLADRAAKIIPVESEQAAELFDIYVHTNNLEKAKALLPLMHAKTTRGWRLAWLAAREEIGDATVIADWQQLADSLPHSLVIQLAAIHSPAVLADRALTDRTIDRLKAMTGDDGIEWRLARARWLVAASDDAKNRANAAAEMMTEVARVCPDYAEPRMILGQALARAGDYNGAIASLQLARNLRPRDPRIALKLAGYFVHQGQPRQATPLLDGIENSPRLDAAGRVEAARLYHAAGNSRRAISLLQDEQLIHRDNAARDMLMAQLLAERGDVDGASAVFERWMELKNPPVEVVRAAARFSATHGDVDAGRQRLSRLATIQLPAGEADLIRAQFEAEFGVAATAATFFENAARLAPNNAAVWLAWAGMKLRDRDFPAAITIAMRGLKKTADNPPLPAMRDRALALSAVKLDADAQPLIDALAADPTSDAGIAMLSAISDSQAAHENSDALAERLRKLADQYPQFMPSLDLLVALDLPAGRFDAAATAAARARDMMPVDAEPLRLLSLIWSTAGQWEAALSAGNDWRNRTLDQPQAADIAIATAQIALGRPGKAIDQLSPHMKTAAANASPSNIATIELTARAMCMLNHTDQAWQIVQPLAAKSSDWRGRWLQIVADTAKDSISVADRIDQIRATVSPAGIPDQLSIAHAWYTAGVRLNDADLVRKAESVAEPLTDSTSAPAEAWFLLGTIQLQLESLTEAESSLTRALQLSPDLTEARNNLAMVKLLRNADLPAAQKLASEAVAATPSNSAYHTTLGEIDEQLDDLDSARRELGMALRLEPQNAEALICLASTQNRGGQTRQAEITLARAQALMDAVHPVLSAAMQMELQRLREALKKPAASAALDSKR